jgi:hypothetical protein
MFLQNLKDMCHLIAGSNKEVDWVEITTAVVDASLIPHDQRKAVRLFYRV